MDEQTAKKFLEVISMVDNLTAMLDKLILYTRKLQAQILARDAMCEELCKKTIKQVEPVKEGKL